MAKIGNVASEEIYNDTVVTAGGKVWSDEFRNHGSWGFRIAGLFNVAAGDLSATLSLEGWDDQLNDWIEEPLAAFNRHPAGVALKTSDTFKTAHAQKYRVGIDPTGGTSGPVVMSVTMNDE